MGNDWPMNTIQLDNTTVQSPQTWNELTREQLLYIGSMWRDWLYIIECKQKGIEKQIVKTMQQQRIVLLQVLMSINPFSKTAQRSLFNRIAPAQMVDLLNTTNFIFKENTLTKNLLPLIGSLYGPADGLKYTTIGEFAFAETMYLNYHKTKKVDYLNKLCAILYRPGKESNKEQGDIRDEFNEYNIETRLPIVSKWTEAQKQATLLFYIGCREAKVKRYKEVFPTTYKKAKNKNWANIIIDLAGPKFGTIKETAKTSMDTILIYLQDLAQNAVTQ